MGRWRYGRGRAIDNGLVERLAENPGEPPATSRGHVWLMVISAMLVMAALACGAGTVWVWLTTWPPGVKLVATLVLAALMAALVPRPLRVPKGWLVPAHSGQSHPVGPAVGSARCRDVRMDSPNPPHPAWYPGSDLTPRLVGQTVRQCSRGKRAKAMTWLLASSGRLPLG